MSFISDTFKSVGKFVSGATKKVADVFDFNSADHDTLKTKKKELEKQIRHSDKILPDEQIALSHINKKINDGGFTIPTANAKENKQTPTPKKYKNLTDYLYRDSLRPPVMIKTEKRQIDKNGIINGYNKIKNNRTNEYPTDTGSTKPVTVTRTVDGKKVQINANDINELIGAYKVKNNYGDSKKTIGNIDLETKKYATNPNHVKEIKAIYNGESPRVKKTVKDFNYNDMKKEFEGLNSPLQYISGQISKALNTYGVTPGEFVAVVRKDSGAGTSGVSIGTKNPGNVGNTDDGSLMPFATWIEGSVAAIRNLAERKVKPKKNSLVINK